MQQERNQIVVIKKVRHSRKFLSGIFHVLICYVHKAKTLYINNQYVEDPRLRTSGMTPYVITARGFTLIELLVVVLIIGILAAVALPQYQKAVEKSRATEVLVLAKHLAEAEELYYLENGTYTSSYSELGVKQPVSKYFSYSLDPSIYNIRVLSSKRPYEFRYFMRHGVYSLLKGRFLCLAQLNNTLGTAVCRSFAQDKTGFVYPHAPSLQAYYIN